MDFRVAAGAIGVILEIVSMTPYIRDVIRRETKPHVFTWMGWGLVNTVVGSAQFVSGAGPTTAVTATVALTCYGVAALALVRGEKNITGSDWLCLGASVLAIGLWAVTSEPLGAVILVTIADVFAFAPTVRKAYRKPREETAVTFAIGAIRNLFALLAIRSFTVVNWLYPATLLFTDGSFALMLVLRRRKQLRP